MNSPNKPNNDLHRATPPTPLRVVPPTTRSSPPATPQIPPPTPQIPPPTPKTPPPAPQTPTDTAPKPQTASPTSFPNLRWLVMAGLVGGVVWVSQQPVSNSVRSPARLETNPDSHRVVYVEVPGTLTKFLVKPGDYVQKNDSIALISTEEMQGDILDAQARFDELVSTVESATARIPTYNSKVNEALVEENTVRTELEQLQSELNQLAAGTPPS